MSQRTPLTMLKILSVVIPAAVLAIIALWTWLGPAASTTGPVSPTLAAGTAPAAPGVLAIRYAQLAQDLPARLDLVASTPPLSPNAEDLFCRATKDPHPHCRRHALLGLAGLPALGAEAEAALAAGMQDPDAGVVLAAVAGLDRLHGRLQGAQVVAWAEQALARGDGYGPPIWEALIPVLGATGGPAAVAHLREALVRDEDLEWSTRLIEALARTGDTQSRDDAVTYLAELQRASPDEAIAREPWADAVQRITEALARWGAGGG